MYCDISGIQCSYKTSGFTLIELSIVIVIIGFLVGGALVGRDLIHATELRKQISQLEELKTATNTFRLKYNCLPGDCGQAYNLGLGPSSSQTFDNGKIDSQNDGNGNYATETYLFPIHLMRANLIKAQRFLNSPIDLTATIITDTNWNWIMPTRTGILGAQLRDDLYFWPHHSVSNGIVISLVTPSNTIFTDCGLYFLCSGVIPSDASHIDTKIDDSYPATGTITTVTTNLSFVATIEAVTTGAGGASSAVCQINTTTPNTYNILHPTIKCPLAFIIQ